MSVSRNEPCPCGSGKKYKHCCLGKKEPVMTGRRAILPIILAAVGIGGGIYVGMSKGLSTGLAVGAGGLMLAGLAAILYEPPPPSGRGGDAGAINFGG